MKLKLCVILFYMKSNIANFVSQLLRLADRVCRDWVRERERERLKHTERERETERSFFQDMAS